jgi:hypothetical protein
VGLGRSLPQRDQKLDAERRTTRGGLVNEVCGAISFGAANPSFVLRVQNWPSVASELRRRSEPILWLPASSNGLNPYNRRWNAARLTGGIIRIIANFAMKRWTAYQTSPRLGVILR